MQTKHLCVLIHIWTKGKVGAPWNRFKPSSKISLLSVPRQYFFCGSFVLFMSCVCHAFVSVLCYLVVTWRERGDLLALVCDVYCDFVTFSFWYLGTGVVLDWIDFWFLLSFLFGYDMMLLYIYRLLEITRKSTQDQRSDYSYLSLLLESDEILMWLR